MCSMSDPKKERAKLVTGHIRENYPFNANDILLNGEKVDDKEEGEYRFVTVDPGNREDYWESVKNSFDCHLEMDEGEDGLHVEVIFEE